MSENIFQNKLNAYFNNTNSKELDGLSYSSDSMFLNSRNANNKLIKRHSSCMLRNILLDERGNLSQHLS